MNDIMRPWHVLLAVLAGWIHHRQQKMIEFQNDQIESLLKQLGGDRQVKRTHLGGIIGRCRDTIRHTTIRLQLLLFLAVGARGAPLSPFTERLVPLADGRRSSAQADFPRRRTHHDVAVQ